MEKLTEVAANNFAQGYICAVVGLIQMDNEVDTRTRELFRAGGYKLNDLKKYEIDEHDIAILKKFKDDL